MPDINAFVPAGFVPAVDTNGNKTHVPPHFVDQFGYKPIPSSAKDAPAAPVEDKTPAAGANKKES